MTTIAYDGFDLASDSQLTSDSIKCYNSQKFYRIPSVEGKQAGWLGIAGVVHIQQKLIDWCVRGCLDDCELDGNSEIEAILIYDDGSFLILEGEGEDKVRWTGWSTPWAIGSGGKFAIGAMLAGKTAGQAVKLAATVDTYTGGPIKVQSVIKRPARKQREKQNGLQQVHQQRSITSTDAKPGRRKFR